MFRELVAAGAATLALATVELAQPKGYGRVVRNAQRLVTGIVEEKDASYAQRVIREVNTGLMSAPTAQLRPWLAAVNNDNAGGEVYLNDIVAMAVAAGLHVAMRSPDATQIEEGNQEAQTP